MKTSPSPQPVLLAPNDDDSLNKDGSNHPTWHHSTLCGCVTIDTSTQSVYLATSPGQNMYAFASSNCNPGTNNADYLGNIGGECHAVGTQFTAGPMQSVQFYVLVICDIVDIGVGLADAAKAALKDIVQGLELA